MNFDFHFANGALFTATSVTDTSGTALTTIGTIGAALANNGAIVFTDLNTGATYTTTGWQILFVRVSGSETAEYENAPWNVVL